MSDSQTKGRPEDGKSMKVTDRRMFTPDGELREEYSHLDQKDAAGTASAAPRPEPEPEPPPPEPEPPEPEPGQPTFYDLVRLLAENASVCLQEGSLPGGDRMQSLDLAKLHIDLLGVLKDKTAGNLDAEERALVDDVIYQLRMAYSSQRGF